MQELIQKKLNLLVHLAQIDGHFAQTERDVITKMLEEAGWNEDAIQNAVQPSSLKDFENDHRLSDVLYWALRLIKADGEIHSDEASYCKALALKLKFKPEVIDYYASRELGSREEFRKNISQFSASSV